MSEEVCVVIVTFNNAEMLENLLNDLQMQSRLPDRVVVIDNSSNSDTERMDRLRYPDLQYVRLRENQGSAGGYHEGIRRAIESGQLIYTLDDDVQLNPDTLFEIIEGFQFFERESSLPIGAVRSVGDGHPEQTPTRLAICPWRGTLFMTADGWAGRRAIKAIAKGLGDGFAGRLGKNIHYLPG